mgnify:CR=1 FL=1
MIRKTNQFTAISKKGEKFIIIEYTKYKDITDKDSGGLKELIAVQKILKTSTGDIVKRIKKGEYIIVDSNIVIKSDDQDAS